MMISWLRRHSDTICMVFVLGVVLAAFGPFLWKYSRAMAVVNQARADVQDTHYSLEFTCGSCGYTTINGVWETQHEFWVKNGTLRKDVKCPNCKQLLKGN